VYQALLNKQLEQGKQARLTRTGGVFCASWEWPVLAEGARSVVAYISSLW